MKVLQYISRYAKYDIEFSGAVLVAATVFKVRKVVGSVRGGDVVRIRSTILG